MMLSKIDFQILSELQKSGRLSNLELSAKVNLSASACLRRVQRLESEGIISSYTALLDARVLELSTVAFVEITLDGQSDEVLQAFEESVMQIPNVLECHLMTGSADYLLKVVAKNTEDFAKIHRRYLAKLPGVSQLQSSFSLKNVRQTTALPLSQI